MLRKPELFKDILFTSDFHLDEPRILERANRPFEKIDQMNEYLIDQYNKKATDNTLGYFLGDFCAGDQSKFLQRLKGTKVLILGNHDKTGNISALWHEVFLTYELMYGKQKVFLSHYAHRTWPSRRRGSWHLYGHSHGDLPGIGLSFDVGVDVWDYQPLSIEEVEIEMQKRQSLLSCLQLEAEPAFNYTGER